MGEIGWRGGRVHQGADCQGPKALDVRFEGGLKFGGDGIEVSSLRCYRAGAKGLDVLFGGHGDRLAGCPTAGANRNTEICVELTS